MSKSIPDVRFEKFSGDWGEKKLGDVAEFNPKSTLPEIFEYIDLGAVLGTILTSHRTEYKNTAPSRAQRLAKQGDVFYQTVRPYQKNNYLYNLPYDNYVFSTGYTQMRPYVDGYFLLSILQENGFVSNVLERSTGTSYPAINSNDLSQMYIKVPISKNEQQKIGALFKQLDDTIALQQQLIEQQQQYKKAMLQKMFPQKGERVPKVRFDGFSGEWINQKINNLVTPVVREVPKPKEPYKRLSVRSHAKGTFHQRVEDPSTVSMDKLYVIKENDLVVNITFAWEHAIAIAKKEDDGLLVSHRFPTFIIDKSDINFINQLVTKENFRRQLDLISPGGAGRNRVLNKNDFINLSVLVPKSLEEQQKIGTLFKQLDDTIALHEKKLEDYQQLKKALLQRIFV
ncbi:restriction endonuclease subunit S [Bacillus toyonensis]|uniref:restriction endonuclease subunit S n=1 Tax=Bacillus toyonensis TaxID=155322 RepID=UPI000C00C11F|nr:restriction endonuclease subunit S [Bacillus toyonensis]PGE91771.1 restriction endonuclease subunit S [Bacillus toyonensis]